MAKRFYTTVSVVPDGDGFGVCLDARKLKTPGRVPLVLAQKSHAECVAKEWDAQTDTIKSEMMPCTRLVNVALERTPENRDRVVDEFRGYGGTDLLCYRAGESALSRHQAAQWDPVLKWAKDKGVDLTPTHSIIAIEQDTRALDALEAYAKALSDLDLTLLVHFTAVFGSAILAYAVMEKRLSASDAFALSRLDELWQIEHWGEDEEAKDRADAIGVEVAALAQLIKDA